MGQDMAVGHPIARVGRSDQESNPLPNPDIEGVFDALDRRGRPVDRKDLEVLAVKVKRVVARRDVSDLDDDL